MTFSKTASIIFAFVSLSMAARADIVVGVHLAKYGTLIVVGHPNKDVQPDMTYSVQLETIGSHSEDNGAIEGNELNKKVKLRAGQYAIDYSSTHSTFEIREGEVTIIKLQKVSAAPIDKTASVSLLKARTPTEDDSSCFETIATWQRTGSVEVHTGHQECNTYNANPFGWFPNNQQRCYPGTKFQEVTYPWKSAYFEVLPGTYSMLWTSTDQTTHQEDMIQVN